MLEPSNWYKMNNPSFTYWTQKTHTDPSARALASRLNLDLPQGKSNGFKCGLMYPMRRLILTGEDNSENKRLLFGPTWEGNTKAIHHICRIDILLESTLVANSKSNGYDEGCPVRIDILATPEEENYLSGHRNS